MTILGWWSLVLATCVVVWLVQQNRIPAPFHWIAYAVLVVVWNRRPGDGDAGRRHDLEPPGGVKGSCS